MGSVTIATRLLLKWNRNSRQTSPTIKNCCVRLDCRLSIARSISALSYLSQLLLDVVDDASDVGPASDDDDAAYGFALSVPLGQPAAHLRSDTDTSDVAQ